MRKFYKPWNVSLVVMLMIVSSQLFAQSLRISGSVKDESGQPVPGVNILEKGTTNGTVADVEGNYTINVSQPSATLVFSFIGYKTLEVPVDSRSQIDALMVTDVTSLEEVVVTGYSSEKKGDIIGSVASVKTSDLLATPSANLQAQLQGRAAGVTVSGSGEPGAGAKVRIRGFASFGNNDPLYVVDGTPTENPSYINPQDIESLQVLKDATAASIYGSRAANGVVIITTKKGKAGSTKVTVDSYYGSQFIPESTFPKMANPQQYGDYLRRSWQNSGVTTIPTDKVYGSVDNPTLPEYVAVNASGTVFRGIESDPAMNPSLYNVNPNAPRGGANFYQIARLPQGQGTNWFKEVTQAAPIQSHQLTVAGGTDKGNYSVGLNYFDQDGTIKYNSFKRYTLRVNTMFKPREFLRFGENIQISFEDRVGGDQKGEGGGWAQSYRVPSYIPVYDIRGNFAGSRISGGNGSNPLANLFRGKDNINNTYRIFGNAFGEVDILKSLTFRTSFGIDYRDNPLRSFAYQFYENQEGGDGNSYTERNERDLTWTWTNTLQFNKTFAEIHQVKVLAGSEAISYDGSMMSVFRTNYDFNDPKFMSLRTSNNPTPIVDSYQNNSTLYSLFTRIDYSLMDKYLFNATVRRDVSSKFGPNARIATFPAVGFGWRLSKEKFLSNVSWISDLKLRGGWGQMGSQKNVDAQNQYTVYGSVNGTSWYGLNGSAPSVGYRLLREGNLNTRWETTETTNFGLDASLFDGKIDFTVEYFNTETKDLLVDQPIIGAIQPLRTLPKVNIGTMRNRGIDLTLTNRGEFGNGIRYNATATFTHYTNELTKFNGVEGAFISRGAGRLNDVARVQVGNPLSSFFGYQRDGFFQSTGELSEGPTQPYATVGSWRFKDISGPNGVPDGRIDDKDRTYLGSPIPVFQMGINLSLAYKNFDFTAFFFWNYGNKIYNYTKWWTDLRGFVGGISERVVTDSWTPENRNATLPILNNLDSYAASVSSDFYIESGSYFRARTVQLGYKLPQSFLSKYKIEGLRIYAQGQNLFTITKYSGPDPDINIQGDDLSMGIDSSGFPNSRQFIFGLNLTF